MFNYSSKDSNAYFLDRIRSGKAKLEYHISNGVIKESMSPSQKIKALSAQRYFLWSKDKQLTAREEINNQKLTKWVRHY